MAASAQLRRALLYVPGSSKKMLDKSRGMTVDCAAYDLEDSVTPRLKAQARDDIRHLLEQEKAPGIKETAVRINSIGSGLEEDDLKAVCDTPSLDTIVIPKVNSASDLRWADDFIKHQRSSAGTKEGSSLKPVSILALIESAKALVNLNEICRATPSLVGLIFAAEDFALDLSITRTPFLTEFVYARSAIVTAARAHKLPSAIDLVCTAFRGEKGLQTLEQESLGGKGLGFNGKQCIHPVQVGTVQQAFAPSNEEVEWAVRILIADEKAEKSGRGAWTMDGKMIDVPVVGKARDLVSKAEACGMDMDGLRVKWASQEPE